MKALILGSDGYIGNALIHSLDCEVMGLDNGFRERAANSLTPIKKHPNSKHADITTYWSLKRFIKDFKPDVIFHLAEQPSAPYSMESPEKCEFTMHNNIIGTMNVLWAIKEVNPDIHLIKIGTAGEYPDWLYQGIEIPEKARIDVNYQGKDWTIPTPRYFGSWYHGTKFADSYFIDYACKVWGLKATDINQAPVYGYFKGSRFDYDEQFGTVANRFAVQKVAGIPLTVYGTGEQERGFIHIKNSIEALKLVMENPPEKGEYRIIHQLTETHKIKDIAKMFDCEIQFVENPRAEMASNEFKFECKWLKEKGLKPIRLEDSISELVESLRSFEIDEDKIMPKTKWK